MKLKKSIKKLKKSKIKGWNWTKKTKKPQKTTRACGLEP
jgi:hypothetical protein